MRAVCLSFDMGEMNIRLNHTLRYLISILLMLVLLALSFKDADFSNLCRTLAKANYWWVVIITPILILSHLLRALRWKYLMRPVKSDVRLSNLFSALMIGYMVSNVVPRAGELVPFQLIFPKNR